MQALTACLTCGACHCTGSSASSSHAARHGGASGHRWMADLDSFAPLSAADGSAAPDSAQTACAPGLAALKAVLGDEEDALPPAASAVHAAAVPAAAQLAAAEDAAPAGALGFAVTALSEYAGIEAHLGTPPEPGTPAHDTLLAGKCTTCGHEEAWVCLQCFSVLCSRYAAGHAAAHAEGTGHDVAVSLSDMSVWSFGKGAYLDVFNIHALHTAFAVVYEARWGEPPQLPVITLS